MVLDSGRGRRVSVCSAYKVLEEIVLVEEGPNDLHHRLFSNLWKSPAPSKVVAFSWMAMLDRIPTRSNLLLRNVLNQGGVSMCVLCVVWSRD